MARPGGVNQNFLRADPKLRAINIKLYCRPLMRRYCDPSVRSCILLCSIRRIRSRAGVSNRTVRPRSRLFAQFSDPTFIIAPCATVCTRVCVRFISCFLGPINTIFTGRVAKNRLSRLSRRDTQSMMEN